jgi:hypothetical protein
MTIGARKIGEPWEVTASWPEKVGFSYSEVLSAFMRVKHSSTAVVRQIMG